MNTARHKLPAKLENGVLVCYEDAPGDVVFTRIMRQTKTLVMTDNLRMWNRNTGALEPPLKKGKPVYLQVATQAQVQEWSAQQTALRWAELAAKIDVSNYELFQKYMTKLSDKLKEQDK